MEDEPVIGFASLLSAQSMFPVLSPQEMAGHYQENEISTALRLGRVTGPGGAWDRICARISAIPEYDQRFKAVCPGIATGVPITFACISKALASFISVNGGQTTRRLMPGCAGRPICRHWLPPGPTSTMAVPGARVALRARC